MITFVVAMTSNDEDIPENTAIESSSFLYTGIEENNLSMWIGWIFVKTKHIATHMILKS